MCAAAAIAALTAGPGSEALARPSCKTARAASLAMVPGAPVGVAVPMTLAGRQVDLLVDTGGIASLLTESTANSLSLTPAEITGRHATIFGGTHIDSFVTAHDIDLGGIRMKQKDFQLLPDGHLPPGLGGTLAPDILSAYDVEFDFAGGRLNLYTPGRCPGGAVSWTTQPHVEVPFKLDGGGHILMTVKLDDKDVSVTLDTGSSRSIFGLESAEATFGFDDRDPQLKLAAETRLGKIYLYPFRALQFGDPADGGASFNIINPNLLLISRADSGMLYGPELILGMSVLRHLHLYIDYKQQRIYATPATE